jgi:integrase
VSESSKSPHVRKADRPQKPYPDFPLTPHPHGAWVKKIRGRIHYFGKWGQRVNGKLERIPGDGWEEALAEYKSQADDLHAGRTPRVTGDGLTLAHLCNHFLTAKLRKKDAGELGGRVFAEYKNVTDLLVTTFGANRLVDDLAADDFAALRATMAKRWGPVRMVTETVRVKSVFKYATENGLVEKPVRYGSEFKPPSRSVLRRHRAKSGAKMLEAAELRALLGAADPVMKSMILLGINCGMGNTDCAALALQNLDLEGGWLDYPRPKTGVARRCPLWPETVEALRAVIDGRPKPAEYDGCGLVFLNGRGTGLIRVTDKNHTDLVSVRFSALLKRLKLYRKGIGFYVLRHVFRTVADAARDPVAIDLIMGHTDPGMGAVYRERVDDARLLAVANVVRDWLRLGKGWVGG